MMTIIECGLSDAAHEEMKRSLTALVEGKKRSYLIVPEQQTVIAEGELASELPEYAPLYFEVTNFTRLADTVFRHLGGVAEKHADNSRKTLIMWKTLTELSPMLDMTSALGDISEGVAERALSAVGEIDAKGIDADSLAECLGSSNISPRLRRKIADIVKIYALYKKNLGEKYSDTEMGLATLRKKLDGHPDFFRGVTFYIEGFTSFTEGQYSLIARLCKMAEVNIILPLPRGREDAFEYGEILSAKKRLLSIAAYEGAERKLVRLSDFDEKRPVLLTEVERILWRSDGEIDNDSLQNSDVLRVFEAYTPFEECDFVASDIKKRVIAGASYSDFAIIAKNPEDYFGMLDTALDAAEIPHFLSHPRELSEFEAIKLILTAYSAIIGKYKRDDIISFMKCGFSDIPRSVQDTLELYAERWQISGKAFTSDTLWSMNPDGYTTRWRDGAAETLLKINEARRALIDPLIKLDVASVGSLTVKEHASALYAFLVSLRIEEKLYERYGDDGESIWKVICDALDTLTEVLEGEKITRDVFLSQLGVVFGAARIGKIPAYIDEVTVGGAAMLRLYGKRHIYILGVNYGEFPGTPRDDSYFSERDKAQLSELGISIMPDMDIRCARELFTFTRAMSFAKESVTILYTALGADFKAKKPADLIARLTDISRGKIAPRKISELSPLDMIYTVAGAVDARGAYGKNMNTAIENALSTVSENVIGSDKAIENGSLTLSKNSAEALYSGDMALTQSRIDTYVSCPLSYFCRYNLKLDSGEPYVMDYSGAGSFVHAVLENFFSTVEKEGLEIGALTEEKKSELTLASAKKYLSELCGEDTLSADARMSLSRLYRATLPVIDDLCKELSDSRFKPKFFELSIKDGEGDTPEPSVFTDCDGNSVRIYGQIDRVDAFSQGNDVFVRVIDYKTGQKKFSPNDLLGAENLQMFLYLKSITESKNVKFHERLGLAEGGKLIPAGVVYVKTALTDVKVGHDTPDEIKAAERTKLVREGMILNDPSVIGAENPEYSPVKFKKDGTPYANSEKYLYTPDGWDNLMKTVEESVIRVSRQMRGGDLKAIPKKNGNKTPCEYCEYKPICRKSAY